MEKLPPLAPGSGLSNYLAFALLDSPRVEAAYYDWAASVEGITVERSLPDPQLTLMAVTLAAAVVFASFPV